MKYLAKITSTSNSKALIITRIISGIILAAHGSQKLFGLFGGYGLEGTGNFMDSIGLHPGYLMAFLAGSVEFLGGIALILGLLTRIAGFFTSILLIVAIFTVHINNGFFMSTGGIEFALILLAATISNTIEGGGKFSLDRYIAKKIIR